MKRYKFRLGQVLHIRQVQEERERADLAARRQAEAAAAVAADQRRLAYDTTNANVVPLLPTNRFLAERGRREVSAATLAAACADLHLASTAAAAQQVAWAAAARKVNALERLDERKRAEHAVEARRAEDAIVDDLVVSRYRRPIR